MAAGVVRQRVVAGLGETQRRPRPGVTGLPAAVQQNDGHTAWIACLLGSEALAVAAPKQDLANRQWCRGIVWQGRGIKKWVGAAAAGRCGGRRGYSSERAISSFMISLVPP